MELVFFALFLFISGVYGVKHIPHEWQFFTINSTYTTFFQLEKGEDVHLDWIVETSESIMVVLTRKDLVLDKGYELVIGPSGTTIRKPLTNITHAYDPTPRITTHSNRFQVVQKEGKVSVFQGNTEKAFLEWRNSEVPHVDFVSFSSTSEKEGAQWHHLSGIRGGTWNTSVKVLTKGVGYGTFIPLDTAPQGYIAEKYKFSLNAAAGEVMLALNQGYNLGISDLHELIIGFSNNTKSGLRHNGQWLVTHHTPGVLSDSQPTVFQMELHSTHSSDNGFVTVKKLEPWDPNNDVIINWKSTIPIMFGDVSFTFSNPSTVLEWEFNKVFTPDVK